MTALEKRKYLCAIFYEMLSSYGYFVKKNEVWRYSPEGEYVIHISCELDRYGFLNDVGVEFGSFYEPIAQDEYNAKKISLGGALWLASYARNTGLGKPLMDNRLTYEEQVDSIFPYFRMVLPLLQIGDDLVAYLRSAEKLIGLHTASSGGLLYFCESNALALAYLSLGKVEDALRVAQMFAKQYAFSANLVRTRADYFRDSDGRLLKLWSEREERTIEFINTIQDGSWVDSMPEIERRKAQSIAVCNSFFRKR